MAHHNDLIPKYGGYRKLKSFQVAQLVFDLTVRFCDRYVDPKSRTVDQMIQAARSGTQNIAEASKFSGTSKKMELKLTGVARASLEELKLDYEDFLRQRKLPLWPDGDSKRWDLVDCRCKTVDEVAAWIHRLHEKLKGRNGLNRQESLCAPAEAAHISSMQSISSIPRITYPEIAANAAHVLIGVASALLDRQLAAQAKALLEEGGFTERLHRKRTEYRDQKRRGNRGQE